jgi:hypothetical protein
VLDVQPAETEGGRFPVVALQYVLVRARGVVAGAVQGDGVSAKPALPLAAPISLPIGWNAGASIEQRKGRWPASVDGGYPLIYYTADGAVLCSTCASTEASVSAENEQWRLVGADIFYEGAAETCAHCNLVIESAYGDPEGVSMLAPCRACAEALASRDHEQAIRLAQALKRVGELVAVAQDGLSKEWMPHAVHDALRDAVTTCDEARAAIPESLRSAAVASAGSSTAGR